MPPIETPGVDMARESRLISRVWPNGIPQRDRIVLEALGTEERARTLDRLEAVWRADQGEPLAPLAELAGLKRAGFFNLRRAWREKSLAGLVRNETRAPRGIADRDDRPLRARAADLLREDPGRRNVDIAKLILTEQPALVSKRGGQHASQTVLQRLERIVQHQRRDLAVEPDFLRKVYGTGLVLDLTAVSIVLDEGEPALAVSALVVETASGFILGSTLGYHDDGVVLQQEALGRALQFLASRKGDLPLDATTRLHIGLMLPATVSAEGMEAVLRPHANELTIGEIGGFSSGQQTVQIIGPRVGRVPMVPRRTLSFDINEFQSKRAAPVMSLGEAKLMWAREVDRHNLAKMAALAKVGIIDNGGSSDGRLANVIRAILQALQSDQAGRSS